MQGAQFQLPAHDNDVVELERRVRFAVVPLPLLSKLLDQSSNGFAGRPAAYGLPRHYEIAVRCRRALMKDLQYVVDIKTVDRATRDTVIAAVCAACDSESSQQAGSHPPLDVASILAQSSVALNAALEGIVTRVTLFLTPTFTMTVTFTSNGVLAEHITIAQRFDFAAAHRLHNPLLSSEENLRCFGKCNNLRGHGHNYQFEVRVAVPVAPSNANPFSLQHLESLAEEVIINRFDHKHLNEDTQEFDVTRGGLIPTVENIARVFHGFLAQAFAPLAPAAQLVGVTVWETDRTSATFPATLLS